MRPRRLRLQLRRQEIRRAHRCETWSAALLSAALPGSLYIYQGDELGLPEVEDLPAEAISDPMHFRSGGRDPGRDGCRVPLPWTSNGPSFGFGDGGSRLPQPENWGELSVAVQRDDPTSMLRLYRSTLTLRRREPGLLGENFAWLDLGEPVIAFRRGRDLACVVNLGADAVPLPPHSSVLLASDDLPGDRRFRAVGAAAAIPPGTDRDGAVDAVCRRWCCWCRCTSTSSKRP